MENTDKIYNALKTNNKPLKSGDLAEKTGLDKKDVDKVLKNLMKNGKIFSPARCFYTVKN